MNNYKVDITNCDREPIHIPGKVQAHGFLLAIDAQARINYASDNVAGYLGVTAALLLNQPVSVLNSYIVLTDHADLINQLLSVGKHAKSFDAINPYPVNIKSIDYNLIISQSGSDYLLEFEPLQSDLEADLQRTIGRSVSGILSGRNLQSLLNNAAQQVKNIIGYDRVMIYKFLDDGHGEVIAEVKDSNLEPFLGLHYPASDIPRQARELYKQNLTRIVTDVNTEPSPILALSDTGGEAQPLDLTCSTLRAVSPIHIQYLKNMGVSSSFSISLLYQKELWGLIACHNYTPRFIDYKAREATKLIGQIISSALEYKQDEEDAETAAQYAAVFNIISGNLRRGGNIRDALIKNTETLLSATSAAGAALLFEGAVTTLGQTPDTEQITALAAWLKAELTGKVYRTHNLPGIYPAAKQYSAVASGVLACSLSREMGEMILWFKPEQITTINWAGNPDKPAEPDAGSTVGLSPRHSFGIWSETVRYTSRHWNKAEINSAVKLQEEVVYAINRQANEIRTLNEKLKQAYDELDTFTFTISHDLRTPLSTIINYSELLLVSNNTLDDDARRLLDKVIGGAGKMNFLIKEVLNYSQIGRTEVQYRPIDMRSLLYDLKQDLLVALKPQNLLLTIENTPPLQGDPTMISQVFTNLLHNAIKYSSKSNPALVTVNGYETSAETVYTVKDNGIGIHQDYFARIFDLFKRMENAQEYEGTGVGLAIVKRIIEKHNGRIAVESELGAGTTFIVSFMKENYGNN